jgi:hypothetical protein
MNPFRLRQTKLQAQLPGACSGRVRRIKTPPVPLSGPAIPSRKSNSTRDCGDVFVYVKFTAIIPPTLTCVQCNMNFFSSSRKVFAPV